MANDGPKYGELVVLGGESDRLPAALKNRHFELRRTEVPTAILPSRTDVVNRMQQAAPPTSDASSAVMSFELDDRDVVVSFAKVGDKDMFQVGRQMSTKNEVQLMDMPSVSRFACRIVIDRAPPYEARIYAGAFDTTSKIFLGKNAFKDEIMGEYDALITNGILILHPPPNGPSDTADWTPVWREVSVTGKLYRCSEGRAKPNLLRDAVPDETNRLVDGTIIDFGGVCLLWRSFEACRKFDEEALQRNVAALNQMHNLCPVQLQTLILKRPGLAAEVLPQSDPYAYRICGHVLSKVDNLSKCPKCRNEEPGNVLVKLQLGQQPRIYIDVDANNVLTWFFFKPCGHVASAKTARYWSRIPVRADAVTPQISCPFCFAALDPADPVGELFFS